MLGTGNVVINIHVFIKQISSQILIIDLWKVLEMQVPCHPCSFTTFLLILHLNVTGGRIILSQVFYHSALTFGKSNVTWCYGITAFSHENTKVSCPSFYGFVSKPSNGRGRPGEASVNPYSSPFWEHSYLGSPKEDCERPGSSNGINKDWSNTRRPKSVKRRLAS